jgi:hypothetical protein
MFSEENEQLWLPVIGRSLARISMHLAQVENKTISERAFFLESLGLEKKEIAIMLGSSPASIAELLRQRLKKGEAGAKSKKAGK